MDEKLMAAFTEATAATVSRMEDEENGFFWIRRGNIAAFDKKLELVNRRARKLGVEEMSYRVLAEILVPRLTHDEVGTGIRQSGTSEWIVILPSDVQVKLAGWEFLMTVAHFPEGNLLLSVPGASEMSEAMSIRVRDLDPVCDHCHTRRIRKETFVVQHEDGREKLVGRNCLRDYLGHKNAAAMAKFFDAYARLLSDEDERWCEGGGCVEAEGYSTVRYLAYVARSVRNDGWCPRSRAFDGGATADLAIGSMLTIDFGIGWGNMTMAQRAEYTVENAPKAQDVEVAEKTVAWIRDEMEIRSDFDHNLKMMATSAIVRAKGIGICAYAVVAYDKHMERETLKRREAARLPDYKDEWVAEPKTRIRGLPIEITWMKAFDGDYGVRTLVKFVTDEGHQGLWWASCEPTIKAKDEPDVVLNIGAKVLLTGTVKRHEMYQEKKQTSFSRCLLAPAKEMEEADSRRSA